MEINIKQLEDIKTFVDPNRNAEEHEDSLQRLLEDVQCKKLSLELIVKNMGEALTSDDDLTRARGISLIHEILSKITTLELSPPNASTFAQFLAARLLDFPTVPNVIAAINSLVSHHRLFYQVEGSPTNPDFIATAIFSELHIPSFRQPVRKLIYEILEKLLSLYPGAMKNISRDFVVGVIQAMDMEKDPRNLLISFELIRSTVATLPEFSEFTEELFEVIACYFPISFKPDPSDPAAITKEDLEESLLRTMCCTADFAKYCIPFLLDRAQEVGPDEKLLVFQALAYCIEQYHNQFQYTVHTHPFQKEFGAIWSIYRMELSSPSSEEYHRDCLDTLISIVRSLSYNNVHTLDSGDSKEKSYVDSFLEPIIKDCSHQLASPDLDLATHNSIILSACAMSAGQSGRKIINVSLPIAAQCFLAAASPGDKLKTLRLLNRFLAPIYIVPGSHKDTNIKQHLSTYKEPLLSELLDVIKDDASTSLFKSAAIDFLKNFILIEGQLSDDERDSFVNLITETLVSHPPQNIDRSAQRMSLDALVKIQEKYDEIITRYTIPKLMDAVKQFPENDEEDWSDDDAEPEAPKYALNALIALSSPISSYCNTITYLLELVTSVEKKMDLSKEYVLDKIHHFIEKESSNESKASWNIEKIIPKCVSFTIESALSGNDIKILSQLAKIVHQIILNSSVQEQTVLKYLELLYNGKTIEGININNENLLPLGNQWTEQQAHLLPLVASFIVPSTVETLNAVFTENELAVQIVTSSLELNIPSLEQRQLVGAIVNKATNEKILKVIHDKLFVPNTTIDNDIARIQISCYVCKCLCIKMHKTGWTTLRSLGTMLCSVSRDFVNLIIDGLRDTLDATFEKEHHFIVKTLYKHRFYHECKQIFYNPDVSIQNTNANALMALSTVLSRLPEALMQQELPTIFPAIHQSLQSSEPGLIISSLESLKNLTKSGAPIILDHVDSLIKILLNLSTFEGQMLIREQSLIILELFSHFPFIKIHPSQNLVLKTLLKPIDDKKRRVRRAASHCRNEWAVISA